MSSYNSYKDDVNEFGRQARWTFFALFLKVFVPIFALLATIGLVWHIISKPVGVLDQITNPSRMIQTYEWFIQEDKDIKAVDVQIVNADKAVVDFKEAAGPRETWKFQDRDEYNRLATIATGLRQQRASMVADYNAKSDQETRSFLKSKNLPDHYE